MPKPRKISSHNVNVGYDQLLTALQQKRSLLDEAITTIERLAQEDRPVATTSKPVERLAKKRQLSAAGRQRLADSMRKRWAAKRRSAGQGIRKKSLSKRPGKVN